MTPQQIADAMDSQLRQTAPGRTEALLQSPMIQNHAAFLHLLEDGALLCCWFGGSLEGKSDIAIHGAVLMPGADRWGDTFTLSHDADHSEQNPVVFAAPDGGLWLFHTSQPAGNQDECRIRMARLTRDPDDPTRLADTQARFLDLPRAPVAVCLSSDDGLTFPQRLVIEDGPGTCISNDSTDGRNKEMSYPWLLQTPDGTLHLAYTYHRRAIKHVRLLPGWDAPTNEAPA